MSLSQTLVRRRTRGQRLGACPFCRRRLPLTFHHLIPRKLHRRARFKKQFSREELNQGVDVCRDCHNGIHERYDEMTLCREFSTPEALADDPALSRYFEWVSRQKVR
jgi:hypothetical protein